MVELVPMMIIVTIGILTGIAGAKFTVCNVCDDAPITKAMTTIASVPSALSSAK